MHEFLRCVCARECVLPVLLAGVCECSCLPPPARLKERWRKLAAREKEGGVALHEGKEELRFPTLTLQGSISFLSYVLLRESTRGRRKTGAKTEFPLA